jgi:hypothetical protein
MEAAEPYELMEISMKSLFLNFKRGSLHTWVTVVAAGAAAAGAAEDWSGWARRMAAPPQ